MIRFVFLEVGASQSSNAISTMTSAFLQYAGW